MTDQIRRFSRAACASLRETCTKFLYPAHSVSRLMDVDAENSETQTVLNFAKNCGQLSPEVHAVFLEKIRQTGRILGGLPKKSWIFCPSGADSRPLTPAS